MRSEEDITQFIEALKNEISGESGFENPFYDSICGAIAAAAWCLGDMEIGGYVYPFIQELK